MTDKRTQAHAAESNMAKDPADWVTGDEPMTGAQRSYLKTLSEEAHEPFDDTLSKAAASRRIDELQARTGRGTPAGGAAARRPDGRADADFEPADEGALESLGRAVGETVLGSEAPTGDDGDAERARRPPRPG